MVFVNTKHSGINGLGNGSYPFHVEDEVDFHGNVFAQAAKAALEQAQMVFHASDWSAAGDYLGEHWAWSKDWLAESKLRATT